MCSVVEGEVFCRYGIIHILWLIFLYYYSTYLPLYYNKLWCGHEMFVVRFHRL